MTISSMPVAKKGLMPGSGFDCSGMMREALAASSMSSPSTIEPVSRAQYRCSSGRTLSTSSWNCCRARTSSGEGPVTRESY